MDPAYSAVHCWYTMPLEGNSVKGCLELNKLKYRLALPVDVTHAITRSLFEALAFIHDAGVIHADLKPANILMAYGCTINSPVETIRVKLADFGASAKVTDKEMDACGTSWFCSPETYSDSPTFTTAVDIWAAGCTVYEMLTGEHLIDVYDVETNYVLESVHGDIEEDIDSDSDSDDMSVREGTQRTDFDILDDANDVSTGASEDDASVEKNMMIVCEKLFGRPPKETRSIFGFYNDMDEIKDVEYPLPRIEIVDLLLKRHCLGKITDPEKIAEIAAFIVSCMRYRPGDRITAGDALRSSWLTSPMST
jgi:serine/threonine protein kinase